MSRLETWVRHVSMRWREFELSGKRFPLVVACSGGADSTALSVVLARVGRVERLFDPHLAYVNHGWRGDAEIRADVAQIRALGKHLNVPVHVSPPPALAQPKTEAAARSYRYAWLAGLAATLGAPAIATGHHRRDQAETVLMRALRGSGSWGLAGMLPARRLLPHATWLLRPLLDVDPWDLRAMLEDEGITWREDPSNADQRFDRVRVRARLAGPGGDRAVATLTEIAGTFARRRRALQRRVTQSLCGAIREFPWSPSVAVDRGALRVLDDDAFACALRHIGHTLRTCTTSPLLTRRHVALARTCVDRSGAVDLPNNLVLSARGTRVWLATRDYDSAPPLTLHTHRCPDCTHWPTPQSLSPMEAIVDTARVVGSLQLRPARRGDRFSPFGRARRQGSVNVFRWLKSQGIARYGRRGQVVAADANDSIVWVVGQRIAKHVAVTPSSREVAHVRVDTPTRRALG